MSTSTLKVPLLTIKTPTDRSLAYFVILGRTPILVHFPRSRQKATVTLHMKLRLETTTVTLLMCAALALSSCTKKTITPAPEPDPQPAEVGFTAASQAVWVKSADAEEFPYDDFGVWGIARQGSLIYNLWGNGALMDVNLNTTTGYYEPAEAAYWLKGYTYDFLAVAPFEDDGLTFNRVTTKEDQTTAASPSDYMTVTYDMSSKYTAGNYDFDLLGAAAQTHVDAGGYSTAQTLKFWHLFSKLSIKVIFVDASGVEDQSDNNEVTNLSIRNVNPKGNFTLQYVSPAGNTGTLSVVPTPDSQAQSKTLEFDANSEKDSDGRWNANIIPQTITGFVIDVAYNVTGSDGKVTYYSDSISLANSTPATYDSNGKYNWTIKINPKGGIGLSVEIAEWGEEQIDTDITID